MQDQYIIMTRGFKNVREGDRALGYQFNIRIPYYRGTFASLIHTLMVNVDGEDIPLERIRFILAGKEMTLPELDEADEIRWNFREAATLRVLQDGGLEPGLHTVQVGMTIRKSYSPPEDPQHLYPYMWRDGVYHPYMEPPTVGIRKMTLVQ